MNLNIPEIVFIVPYRKRESEKKVFESIMPKILNHLKYNIFFIHQNDTRLFNRGAIKNIGFLYVKKKWPNYYKNITLVFNDVDCISYYKDQFLFKTKENIIKHHFGFKQTLGGIFSIIASDFEKINGFPNIWTWGLEDNIILKRAKINNIKVDYSKFIDIKERQKIIFMNNYDKRKINKNIFFKFETNENIDGINLIKKINYGNEIEICKNIFLIDINYFETGEDYKLYLNNTEEITPVKTFKKFKRPYQNFVFNKNIIKNNLKKKKNIFKIY